MFNDLENIFNRPEILPEERLNRFQDIGDVGGAIANIFIAFALSGSFIALGYAAIQYIMSSGDPKNISKAWNGFLWAAIGLMIGIAAIGIKTLVFRGFGVTSNNIINNDPGF